jgi:hypothetical protein
MHASGVCLMGKIFPTIGLKNAYSDDGQAVPRMARFCVFNRSCQGEICV